MTIEGCNLCIVIEHLLEVGDQPYRVDRITMETAAHLVVDSAFRHLFERQVSECQRVGVSRGYSVGQQELVQRRLRELGLQAGSAADVIKICGEHAKRVTEQRAGDWFNALLRLSPRSDRLNEAGAVP